MRFLLRFFCPLHWRVALATLLGVAVVASNMGLLGAAGYLIATASATHLLIFLLVPMYLVRLLSITRGLARYAERLTAHDVTLRILAGLRVWLFDGLMRLGPSVTQTLHSGDTLCHLLGDVDEMQNGYLLLVSPFAVALLIGVVLTGVLHIFDDMLALAVAVILVVSGLGLPLLVWVLSRGLGHRSLAVRAELSTSLRISSATITPPRNCSMSMPSPATSARLTIARHSAPAPARGLPIFSAMRPFSPRSRCPSPCWRTARCRLSTWLFPPYWSSPPMRP